VRSQRVTVYAGLVLAAVLLAGFGLIADEVIEGDTLAFDNAVLMWFRDPSAPAVPIGPSWLFEAARDITALGSFTVLALLVVGVTLQLLLTGARRTALFLLVSVIGGTIISTGLKALFDRPRPDLTGAVEVFTASFPSGHATVSAVVYLTIGAILAQREHRNALRVFYVGFAILLTGLIGVSRVYLGVHYPTDVIAGWALGSAWALACLAAALALGLGRTANEAPSR
jgi:undecaprenyl-diphosphatase